jgi:hypothetical protein
MRSFLFSVAAVTLFSATGAVSAEKNVLLASFMQKPAPMASSIVVTVDCKNRGGSASRCRAWCADWDRANGKPTGTCASSNCTGCPNP